MKPFDHERRDVYRKAIDVVVAANGIAEGLPRGRGDLADQLHRASTSVSFNIAEGAGEFAKHEKARFYRMARRSATESAAILDACHDPQPRWRRLMISHIFSVATKWLLRNPGTQE